MNESGAGMNRTAGYISFPHDNNWWLPEHLRTTYMVVFSTVLAFGVIGNVMVSMVIFKTKDMRTSTYIFVANLATADLLTLLVWGTQSVFFVDSDLAFNTLSAGICYAWPIIEDAVVFASVLTILCISFERYFAVCQPLRASSICTKNRAYKTCLLVWTIAALYSCLQLTFTLYKPEEYIDGTHYAAFCGEQTTATKAYYISVTTIFFFLPFVIFVIIFLTIAWHLKKAASSDVNTAAARHRNHVVVMLATIVCCFFTCQLPWRVYQIYYTFALLGQNTHQGSKGYRILVFFCEFTFYLHAVMNPVLYAVMSRKFRAGFQKIICAPMHVICCKEKKRSRERETMATTTLNTSSSQLSVSDIK